MANQMVEITTIAEVNEHPNADRLSCYQVFGWSVIAGKTEFQVGDEVIYCPVDSILGAKLEEYLFPPDAKVKLSKSRVRAVRIRQAISQGLLINPRDEGLLALFPALRGKRAGADVADILEVTKYEPPAPAYQSFGVKKGSVRNHPDLKKYTEVEHFRRYATVLKPDEMVSITEKLHGTSARYGKYRPNPNRRFGLLGRLVTAVMTRLGFREAVEFVYGSRNVQLQTGGNLYYKDRSGKPINVYALIAKELNLPAVLSKGEALFGEIVGVGIQKGYEYGYAEPVKYGFYAYDVMVGARYLSPSEFRVWCRARNIPTVPLLYEGLLGDADLEELAQGPSVLAPQTQPVREGIVIKPIIERQTWMGRPTLKYVNPTYLVQPDMTDFH